VAEDSLVLSDVTSQIADDAELVAVRIKRDRRLEQTYRSTGHLIYFPALDVTAHLPEPQQGQVRLPRAPISMNVEVLGDRISLIWSPPPSEGLGPLSFVVIRKTNGAPEHPADGIQIAEVSSCEFEDTQLTPGEMVGYAVLTRRGGVNSVAAIGMVKPVVFFADVRDVRVELDKQDVKISWSPPHGVTDVRVIRKRGEPPTRPQDGDRIPADVDQAIIPASELGQNDYLAIYAVYEMPDGRKFPSPGVVAGPIAFRSRDKSTNIVETLIDSSYIGDNDVPSIDRPEVASPLEKSFPEVSKHTAKTLAEPRAKYLEDLLKTVPEVGSYELKAKAYATMKGDFIQAFASSYLDALKAEITSRPYETYDDKKALVNWVNGELRRFGLAIRSPKTGQAGTLVAGPGNNSNEGRFILRSKHADTGKEETFITSKLPKFLANLALMDAPPREEPLAKVQVTSASPGKSRNRE
jgi:hypothetical protein